MAVGSKQTHRFGPFELDSQCGQLRASGLILKVHGQPIQILEVLLEKPGQLVTRDELRDRLWTPETFVDFEHSLNTAIKKLRQALGDEADTPRYIETLPKRGYRFIGKLDDEQIKTRERLPAGNTRVEIAEISGPAHAGLARGKWIAVTSAVAVIVIGTALYFAARPATMPRIVASHALTKTGYRKWWIQGRLLTDGNAIYFRENRTDRAVTMQLSLSGGDPSEIPVAAAELRDISRDGSELLFTAVDPNGERDDAWVQSLRSGPPRLIVKNARWPIWTSDGRSIIFARGDNEFYRAKADGTDVRFLGTAPDVTGLTLSPDGRHVRFGVQSTGTLWEAGSDGSKPHQILLEHTQSVALGDWSPDGKYFFFLSSDGERLNLWVSSEERHWYKRTSPTPKQLTFGPLSIAAPLVSRDGRHLYAVGREPHAELIAYDPRTGGFVPYLGGIPACLTDFSREGERVAYVSYPEGTLWRSRIDGSERQQLTVPPLQVGNPRWSPDGRLIAFEDLSRHRRGVSFDESRIYVVSTEGGGPMLLLSEEGGVRDPTWSSDGSAMAYAVRSGRESEIWILNLHTQKRTIVPGSNGYWSPRWSPDGKYLIALKGWPAKLVLFSFATGQWKELGSEVFSWPNWSRDSRFVYAVAYRGLVRIGIPEGKMERVPVPLQGLQLTGLYYSAWFGLTPDERLITTRDTGLEEIYAFDLQYK